MLNPKNIYLRNQKKLENLIPMLFGLIIVSLFIYTYLVGLQGDDFYYLTNLGTGETIKSINDMIDATIHYYLHWNGRFLINFLNHLIVNAGMIVQTIVVIFSLIVSLFSIYKLIKINDKFSSYCIAMLFLLGISSSEWLFNITCLNISLNYFFIIPIYIVFIRYLILNKEHYNITEFILLFFLAFLCGSLTESYSFSLALVILIQIIRKQFTLSVQNIIIGIAYVIGVFVLLLSPGSGERSGLIMNNPLFLLYWLNGIVNAFTSWNVIPVICAFVSFKFNNKSLNSLSKTEHVLMIYALVQLAVMIASPYLPERALLLSNLILLTLSIKWFSDSRPIGNYNYYFCFVILGKLVVDLGTKLFA